MGLGLRPAAPYVRQHLGEMAGVRVMAGGLIAMLESIKARDPAARERMGRAGRMRVESTYSWPVIAGQWLDIVERIIQKRPA